MCRQLINISIIIQGSDRLAYGVRVQTDTNGYPGWFRKSKKSMESRYRQIPTDTRCGSEKVRSQWSHGYRYQRTPGVVQKK